MIIREIPTGRIVLLQNTKAVLSPVLQGEIYLKAKGEELISYLSQVFTERYFRKYASTFVRRSNGLNNKDNICEEISIDKLKTKGVIDFRKIKYETCFGAHWLYIKNLGNEITIHFRDGTTTLLNKHETLATCSGKAYTYPEKKIVKSKDTIIKIILTEKIH